MRCILLVKKINCFLAAHFPLILEYASEGAFSKWTIACSVLIGLIYLSHSHASLSNYFKYWCTNVFHYKMRKYLFQKFYQSPLWDMKVSKWCFSTTWEKVNVHMMLSAQKIQNNFDDDGMFLTKCLGILANLMQCSSTSAPCSPHTYWPQ